jgi:hypothetical protein
MFGRIIALALCSSLAACASRTPSVHIATDGVTEAASPWRAAITAPDSERLERLRATWDGLHARLPARVRAAQGKLADPAAALDYPGLTPGSYRCKVVRMRAPARGAASVRNSTSDFCYVSGAAEGFSFVKQTGTDAAAGYLYPDGARYVFLGARQRRAGANDLVYGSEPARDVVGVVERVGGFRWRLAVAGADAGELDIYELTPVPPEQQPRG